MTATGRARVEFDGITSHLRNPGAKQNGSALNTVTHQFAPVPIMWDSLARATGDSAADGADGIDGSQPATAPLQFNATGDPQTVYSRAEGLAAPMEAHLVTVHGPGHAQVATGNPHVDQQAVRYLNTGELGPVDQIGHAPHPLIPPLSEEAPQEAIAP